MALKSRVPRPHNCTTIPRPHNCTADFVIVGDSKGLVDQALYGSLILSEYYWIFMSI